MHEFTLMNDLIRKIEAIARENEARKVAAVTLRIGAMAHISAEHLREHFEHASLGTCAENAQLSINTSSDETEPTAQDIVLESVNVEI